MLLRIVVWKMALLLPLIQQKIIILLLPLTISMFGLVMLLSFVLLQMLQESKRFKRDFSTGAGTELKTFKILVYFSKNTL